MNRYKNCPICGGNVDFRQESSDNNDNDEMIDVFECQDCKTTFSSDGNSDALYRYFYNVEPEDQEITIKMTYGDLNYTLSVFEDWIDDHDDYNEHIRAKIIKIFHTLTNIWDNEKNG